MADPRERCGLEKGVVGKATAVVATGGGNRNLKRRNDTRSIGALVLGDEARLHGHGLRVQSPKVKFELASMTYLKFGEAFTVRLKVL